MVCLQETKVQGMNNVMARSLGVGCFLNWKSLNARGTVGGILLPRDKRKISMVDSGVGSFSVSCLFRMAEDGYQMGFLRGV